MRTFRIGCLPFSEQTPSAPNIEWELPRGRKVGGLRNKGALMVQGNHQCYPQQTRLFSNFSSLTLCAMLGKIMGRKSEPTAFIQIEKIVGDETEFLEGYAWDTDPLTRYAYRRAKQKHAVDFEITPGFIPRPLGRKMLA